jgi:hypothetical protein
MADARAAREIPTRFMAWLAEHTGAEVFSERPGHVVAILPNEDVVEASVTQENVFCAQAEAYRRNGIPVPESVIENIERWDREHGKR